GVPASGDPTRGDVVRAAKCVLLKSRGSRRSLIPEKRATHHPQIRDRQSGCRPSRRLTLWPEDAVSGCRRAKTMSWRASVTAAHIPLLARSMHTRGQPTVALRPSSGVRDDGCLSMAEARNTVAADRTRLLGH